MRQMRLLEFLMTERNGQLGPIFSKTICKRLGEPEIDLFASWLNKQVKWYCSWQPDPEAIFVDSFLCDWGHETVYAFPPFSVIHKAIKKFIHDGARGILVVPLWKTQPWSTLLVEFMCKAPLVFDITTDELYLPFREGNHPLAGRLRMLAVFCSANLSEAKDFQTTSYEHYSTVAGQRPSRLTGHTWHGGNGIVSPTGWIPLCPL